MVVVCTSSILALLAAHSARRAEYSSLKPETRRLAQRVSELMAAESLADLTLHGGANLTEIAPPPDPLFKMDLLDSARLILAPSEKVGVDREGKIQWEGIKSVELIRIER